MPLEKHLIEVRAQTLVACRECHGIADVSMTDSPVKLICPNCYGTLGSWRQHRTRLLTSLHSSLTALLANKKNSSTAKH